jgi:hypothetical protein
MTYKQSHGLYMPFHGHTIVLTALHALSRPLQQPEGPSKSLSKMERNKCFVEAVCAGPGHENACRGRAGSRPANDSAVEAVRVLLKVVRVLVKAVRVGELC